MLVGTSETVRMFSNYHIIKQKKELKIRQWIAGIIDGDGYIGITKKGYCTIEIVMEVRDIACLIKFKNRYGGSIKSISGGNAFRYRLHHKQGLIQFIIDINGMLYNPTRIEQFQKLCNLYNIDFIQSPILDFNSAYLSGLFDTDGSISMNITSYQVFITISQKRRYLLDMICSIYGGKVYTANNSKTAFKWTVSKKEDILNLIENYFHWNGCISEKKKRFNIVKEFYKLSSQGAFKSNNIYIKKLLENFIHKWSKYGTVDNLLKRQSNFYLFLKSI